MPTIETAYQELRNSLSAIYDVSEASAIAHSVLEHITGLGRVQRLSEQSRQLQNEQLSELAGMEAKLLVGTPLQYVTGEAFFMSRKFLVTPAVLIPRPETEELVQWIISEGRPQSVLDIGTGSGCIAISLKLALLGCKVTALDVSDDALAVATQNAEKLEASVDMLQLDFLDSELRERLPQFDVIVSNPPYIPISEKEMLHINVREHEPESALFVPNDDALLFYKAMAVFGRTHLNPGGAIYCELHQDYANAAAAMFTEQCYPSVRLRNDINGNQRMIRASR